MHEMTALKSRYRCPRCNTYNSVNVDKIFDGRLLFCCSKCNICALVPKDADADGPDSAYLEFLDLYDNGHIANSVDLNTIMQQERILRPSSEIKALLGKGNKGTTNKFLKEVLSSQKDYVVEYSLIQDSDSKLGSSAAVAAAHTTHSSYLSFVEQSSNLFEERAVNDHRH